MAFGNKNNTPSFVLTLPMKVSRQDELFLSKKFRIGCTVYNQMVTKTTKMWHQLRKKREYKNLIKAIKAAPANSDERKALLIQRSNLIKQTGFSEGTFHKLVVPYQKAYNVNCDVAQKVASAVWTAWDNFFYGKGKLESPVTALRQHRIPLREGWEYVNMYHLLSVNCFRAVSFA